MSDLRRDPIVGRWVIVDTDHPTKPTEFEFEPHIYKGGICPFCYGYESMTPPEIEVVREQHTQPNMPGWQVRVISNKFPALQIEGDLERRGLGMYDLSNGIGAHEVVVETPYHQKDIPDLQDHEVENIISMLCRRSVDLSRDMRFKYIMVFKNFGAAAGASLEHPHTQIIALPMVPKSAAEEIQGAQEYFEFRERCIFCDIIRQEIQEKERLVIQSRHFVSFCPFVSRFPYEIWIMPKKHTGYFCLSLSDEIADLAVILKETLGRLKKLFPMVSYNFIIHSSPVNGQDSQVEGYHWHLELMPKLTRVAGFEWGSGFYLVSTPPEEAAHYLREVK